MVFSLWNINNRQIIGSVLWTWLLPDNCYLWMIFVQNLRKIIGINIR
jgi:hypothetical protein